MKIELISMVDFVLGMNNHLKGNSDSRLEVLSFWKCIKYAEFLNTPLNISMFVPAIKVVDEWEVLREPIDYYPYGKSLDEVHQYQTAKDNVIFEGFEVDNDFSSIVKNSERDFCHAYTITK